MKTKMKRTLLDFAITVSVPFTDAGWPSEGEWRRLTDRLYRFQFNFHSEVTFTFLDDILVRWFDDRVECRVIFQFFGTEEENAARSSAIFQRTCEVFVPSPYDFRIVSRARPENGKRWVEIGNPFSRNKFDPLFRSQSSRRTDK